MDLGAIVQSSQAEPQKSQTHKAQVPIGELAVKGAPVTISRERQTIVLADPKRCRAWKFHNRHSSWYTPERCKDVIEAIAKEGQLEPAIARELQGDPAFDFELIYGMRRRFACEFLNRPLKLRVVTADDRQAAVLMHQENHDRQDITPMERAISYLTQLRGGVFSSQDEIAAELNVSKGLISRMMISAELLTNSVIATLFPDPTAVPVKGAYALAVQMSDSAKRKVIEQAARDLASSEKLGSMTATAILKWLAESVSRRVKTKPLKKAYNVGSENRMIVTRNDRGKVTLAFKEGLSAEMEDDVVAAVRAALKDL